ncbi:TPA: phage tail protein [Klebsiella pneumoniae]
MDSVHHIWCPLSSQEFQDLPDGAETTLTNQLTLGGLLYPEITGGNLSLGAVSTMAYTGLAWPLIDGIGSIYGMYVITGLQETHQEFDRYGKAKKVEFTLSLQRVDEDIRERLQSASVSNLMATLKDGAETAFNTGLDALSDLTP